MAIGEARLAILAGEGRALLADVWAFVRNPVPASQVIAPGRRWALLLCFLIALDIAISVASYGLLQGAEFAGYEAPEPYETELGLWEDLLQLVILAPLIEESIFRGWLSGTRSALALGLRCALGVALMVVGDVVLEGRTSETVAWLVWLAGLLIILGSLGAWLLQKDRDQSVPRWFSENYRALIWVSALAFGFSHLVNYNGAVDIFDGILVLSQIGGGLVLAYTRTRLGLGGAIAQHAAFNFLVFLTE